MEKAHYEIPARHSDLESLITMRNQIENACRNLGPGSTMVMFERTDRRVVLDPECTVGEALVVVNNLIWTELGVRPARKGAR